MLDSLFEIITATGSQKFNKPVKVYFVTNAIDEIRVSMIFIVVTFYSFVGRSLGNFFLIELTKITLA